MANFSSCVIKAFEARAIREKVKDELLAHTGAPEEAMADVLTDLGRTRRELALQSLAAHKLFEEIGSHPSKNLFTGIMATLTKDLMSRAKYTNVEYDAKVLRGGYHGEMADMLSRFRTRLFGFSQDSEGLRKMVKAIYGEATDDAEINKFAKEFADLNDKMIKDFNAAGGSLQKNELWRLPQIHNHKLIIKATLPVWKESIRGKLDRALMTDDAGKVLTDEQLDASLDYVYETITQRGLNKVKPVNVPRLGRKLSRKHAERRFLYFKSSEDWLTYNKEFGSGDVLTVMTNHIDNMAHETALLKKFGPNPQATFDGLMAQAKKVGGHENKELLANWTWNVVSGKVNEIEITTAADVGQGIRNVVTASHLGGAALSAVTDVAFSAITSRYNGISAVKVMARQVSLLNPANEADRVFAVKLGLVADNWTGIFNAGNRYADTYGIGASAKVSEGVIRGSGLANWTDANQKAFGMEFNSLLADNFSKPFADIDGNLKRALQTYDIEKSDWDTFRKTKTLDHKGAKFADVTQEGGGKFHRMILEETDFAVPTPDARVRAIQTGGTSRGGLGEGWRMIMMFKSFPITIMSTHLYRGAAQEGMINKMAYYGQLGVATTVMGGMAVQMKDIAAGREPRPIDTAFLKASFLQGGGLGIFGDFIFSDVNRFGGSFTQTLAGPVAPLVDKTARLTIGNIREAFDGDETNVLKESTDFIKQFTPDTWQTRLLIDSFIDQFSTMADPSYKQNFYSQIRKRRKDYNQGYWKKPGSGFPGFLE